MEGAMHTTRSGLTWVTTSTDLTQTPVLPFQKRNVWSFVPPPVHSRFGFQGHQANAFTAAWWSVNATRGWMPALRSEMVFAGHTPTQLSFPPEAKCCLSGDQAKPHISYNHKEKEERVVDQLSSDWETYLTKPAVFREPDIKSFVKWDRFEWQGDKWWDEAIRDPQVISLVSATLMPGCCTQCYQIWNQLHRSIARYSNSYTGIPNCEGFKNSVC